MRYTIPLNHVETQCALCPAVLRTEDDSHGWHMNVRDYGSGMVFGHVRAVSCPAHDATEVDTRLTESVRRKGY